MTVRVRDLPSRLGSAVAAAADDGRDPPPEAAESVTARRAERAEVRFDMNEPDQLRDEALEVTKRDEDDFDLSKVDLSKARRGPQFKLKRGPEWVRLEDHVRVIFQGDEEVNDALKWLIHDGRYELDFEKRAACERAKSESGRRSDRKACDRAHQGLVLHLHVFSPFDLGKFLFCSGTSANISLVAKHFEIEA